MNGLYGIPQSGMQGAEFQLNVVANNISNLNSSGYETVEPILANLPSQAELNLTGNGQIPPVSTNVGIGVGMAATDRSQQQAPLVATGNPLDLAVKGPGMFVLRKADGQIVYSPQVSLHLQPDGQIVTDQGLSLVPSTRVPANVTGITVDGHGNLLSQSRTGTEVSLGKPETVTFAAAENLNDLTGGLYAASLSSGRPQVAQAGSVQVVSGYRLGSTVDLSTQMIELIQAERSFEANSKALQTIDGLINNVVSTPAR